MKILIDVFAGFGVLSLAWMLLMAAYYFGWVEDLQCWLTGWYIYAYTYIFDHKAIQRWKEESKRYAMSKEKE